LSPARAACLVALLQLARNDQVVLDVCGGLGVVAIEAALAVRRRAAAAVAAKEAAAAKAAATAAPETPSVAVGIPHLSVAASAAAASAPTSAWVNGSPEAAAARAFLAVSLDNDGAAALLAASHARLAGFATAASTNAGEAGQSPLPDSVASADSVRAVGIQVAARVGDALATGLATHSVDAVVSELPFGKAYKRLDVRALLGELHRVLKPTEVQGGVASPPGASPSSVRGPGVRGGRALLVAAEGNGGTACALRKCARRATVGGGSAGHPAWAVAGEWPMAIAGIECCAILLRPLAAPPGALHCRYGMGGGEGPTSRLASSSNSSTTVTDPAKKRSRGELDGGNEHSLV
jgi:hypothetical protein